MSKWTAVAWTIFYLIFLLYAAIHDREFLLSDYDTSIAAVVRLLGWLGMIG